MFHPLDKKQIIKIVEIQLKQLEKQAARAGIVLECSPAAASEIARLGYDPAYGARPLKRVILKQLQDPLAEELLRGGYKPKDTVRVDVVDGELAFERAG